MDHLRQGWRLTRTASGGGARFQHFFLPYRSDVWVRHQLGQG